jgi:hypothetical protein
MRMALYKMACTRLRPSDTRPDLIEAERPRTTDYEQSPRMINPLASAAGAFGS